VTVSIGVSTAAAGAPCSYEQAVHDADLALYAVKARGRDGWACHEPDAPAADQPPDGPRLRTAS
jgi:PleD family two-component response regulator